MLTKQKRVSSLVLLLGIFLLEFPLLAQIPGPGDARGSCLNTSVGLVPLCASGSCILACLDPCVTVMHDYACIPGSTKRCSFAMGAADKNFCRECTCPYPFAPACLDEGIYPSGTTSTMRCYSG